MRNDTPARWIIKLWDGVSNSEIEREGTYDEVSRSCAAYPPGYVWHILPA